MKITANMIKTAKEVAEELFYDYEKFGIRTQEVPFSVGSMDHVSHDWIDGDETEDELNGVCAQDVDTIEKYNNEYFGNYVAIIAGNEYEYGEDDGEIIIRDPVVVRILV